MLKTFFHFIRYCFIWYANNFAVPFWCVGHLHLTMSDYHWLINLGTSIFLNISVFLGFWFDWQNYKKSKKEDK